MDNYNVILHFDQDDSKVLGMVLRNAKNYLAALPDEDFRLAIVINAGGVKQLQNLHSEYHALAGSLIGTGKVYIAVCRNALNENSLAASDIWPEVQIVPAGLVEIVKLQRAGYAYIKP